MKTTSLIVNAIIGGIFCCFWTGCVTTYKPIEIDYLSIDDYWIEIPESKVQIALDDDFLKDGRGTKQYAKMEKKSQVSLVAITIHNSGQEQFSLSGDLEFQTSDGFRVHPLAFEPALESLVETITLDEEEDDIVELDGWVFGAARLANDAKRVVSHVRFVTDMSVYYLDNRILMPDSVMKGFLVLPVKKGTPLDVSIQHNFSGE